MFRKFLLSGTRMGKAWKTVNVQRHPGSFGGVGQSGEEWVEDWDGRTEEDLKAG